MRPRTQITALVCVAAFTLGIGIPLSALALRPATELVEGTVVSVSPHEDAVLVHSVAGARALRGQIVVVRLHAGQRVKNAYGDENAGFLSPGQQVRATVRTGSHVAQQISVPTQISDSQPSSTADPALVPQQSWPQSDYWCG